MLKLARLEIHQARSNFYGQISEFIDHFDWPDGIGSDGMDSPESGRIVFAEEGAMLTDIAIKRLKPKDKSYKAVNQR